MASASPRRSSPLTWFTRATFGLMGMRERALLYGGQLTITSSPGQGATITARLPLLH